MKTDALISIANFLKNNEFLDTDVTRRMIASAINSDGDSVSMSLEDINNALMHALDNREIVRNTAYHEDDGYCRRHNNEFLSRMALNGALLVDNEGNLNFASDYADILKNESYRMINNAANNTKAMYPKKMLVSAFNNIHSIPDAINVSIDDIDFIYNLKSDGERFFISALSSHHYELAVVIIAEKLIKNNINLIMYKSDDTPFDNILYRIKATMRYDDFNDFANAMISIIDSLRCPKEMRMETLKTYFDGFIR